MTFTEIFNDVAEMMQHDSATCKDITGGDPAPFRERITADMTNEAFAALVSDYLYTFELTGHLSFSYDPTQDKNTFSPVEVQRYENALYVTNAAEDSTFRRGDKILAVDGDCIDSAAKKYAPVFAGEAPERQSRYWKQVLLRAKTVTVLQNGKTAPTAMFIQPSKAGLPEKAFEIKALSNETVIMTLPHFMKLNCVKDLIRQNKRVLNRCRNLVIDVRGNGGGNSGEYHCLYPYCFPKGKGEYPVYASFECEINYTEQNCDLKHDLLKEYGLPEKQLKKYVENRGKGFVADVSEDGGMNKIKGRAMPEKVLILTDENCGSSGDSFVEEMKCSPKVTVIGRPTAGINDYTDICKKKYGDFCFCYPMKRSLRIDRGEGQSRKGVPVDVFIPWTPESLKRDVELETALRLIDEAKKQKN